MSMTTPNAGLEGLVGLLACPFCGGAASYSTHRTSDKETIRLNNRDSGFGVNCATCGMGSRTFGIGYPTEEAAAARWNTRATPLPGAEGDARDAWVSVSDALPEEAGVYIGINYGRVQPLRFDLNNWHHFGITRDLAMPSHWMRYTDIKRPTALASRRELGGVKNVVLMGEEEDNHHGQ